uniref:Uncharacterized protein n=1 Tax=viral metagenome TaxID=1070528 RepID=A0A6M3JMI2_9ZZZZ
MASKTNYVGDNATLVVDIESGNAITLKEITTPTAKANYGKVYTKADFSSQGANSLRSDGLLIAAGDKIQFIFKNVGATGNFTVRHGNLNVHRI